MSDIKYWSGDANNNNASSPDGISANEPIKNIDNWGREVMAASKRAYLDREWIDNNHIPTYVSSNSFTVATNLTAIYTVNRRVRLIDSVGNIIYGTITASSYSDPNTTITLALDSTQLNANINQVAYATVTNLSLNVYNKDEVYTKDEVNERNSDKIYVLLSNSNVDINKNITFSAGVTYFDDGSGNNVFSGAEGSLNSNFNNGVGMLDNGSILPNRIYYLFLVTNTTDGNSKPLASLSKTPTLPNGYDKKEYRGATVTDNNSNIRSGIYYYFQDSYKFYFTIKILERSGSLDNTVFHQKVFSPIQSIVNLSLYVQAGAVQSKRILIFSNFSGNQTASNSNYSLKIPANASSSVVTHSSQSKEYILVDNENKVGVDADGGNVYFEIINNGWEEKL